MAFRKLEPAKPREYTLPESECVVVLRKLGSEEMVEIRGAHDAVARAQDELAKATVLSVDGEDTSASENRAAFHEWWTNLPAVDRSLIVMKFNDNHYPSEEQRAGFRKSERLVATA